MRVLFRSLLALCLPLFTLCSWAGDVRFSGNVITNSLLPYTIAASANSNIVGAAPITLRPGAGVALRWKWTTSGADATNSIPIIMKFALSPDGTNWPAYAIGKQVANDITFRVPSQGAPGTNWQTNIQYTVTSPFAAMKLVSVSNNEEQPLIITNFTWWIHRYER